MVEILVRFDPTRGGLHVAAEGVPFAVVALLLDQARQAAAQRALKELVAAARVEVVAPSPDQVRTLLGG